MSVRGVVGSAVVVLSLLGELDLARADSTPEPEINPFACQGRAEVLEADRSIGQIRDELDKRVVPPFLPTDAKAERAIKLCVVAELKKRVGDADTIEYYLRAIEANPEEPGLEMFAARYYGGARGAKGPVTELAEKHYYRALDKLERLRREGRYRDYHAVVEDYVRKGLLVLYQQDGMPLLPWKAYPQHSSGYLAPGLSVSSQLSISRDTRDAVGANEVGGFNAEAGLFALRSPRQPGRFELFEIARSPLRIRSDNQLRIRHAYLGAVDLTYGVIHAEGAALGNKQGYGHPEDKNDIDVRELGVAFERTLPLYPVADLKLAGSVKRVHRVGVVEFLPDCAQDFNVYQVTPSLSRFVSSDKLTIGGTLVFMDIPPIDCAGKSQKEYLNIRGRSIRALNFEYALYSPVLLPSLHLASLRPYRTPTRGWYFYGGYVNDNEVFGDHRTINETFFVGSRLEGPGPLDIGLTESLYGTSGTLVNPTNGEEEPFTDLSGKTVRSSLVVTWRLINPDATPGVAESRGGLAPHSLNWVFPVSFDKATSGRSDFENIRTGTELWWQMFGTALGGPALLMTASYGYQYFYRFQKHVHNVGVTLRLGWREL